MSEISEFHNILEQRHTLALEGVMPGDGIATTTTPYSQNAKNENKIRERMERTRRWKAAKEKKRKKKTKIVEKKSATN